MKMSNGFTVLIPSIITGVGYIASALFLSIALKAASLGNSLCYVDRHGNCWNYAAWDFSFS